MRKSLYPLLALLFGAIGFALRLRQLMQAVDTDTGLIQLHHPATYALIGFTVAAAAALLLLSLTISGERKSWPDAFRCESVPLRLLSVLGALGFAGGALLIGQQLMLEGLLYSLPENPFQGVLALLLLCTCAAALVIALRGEDKGELSVAPVIPGFACCVWLVLTYHSNASDPAVPAYLWQLLAVIACALAWYYTAGFAFQRARPRRTLFFHLAAGTLCITAAADPVELSQRALFLACALWFLTRAAILIGNTGYSGKREG